MTDEPGNQGLGKPPGPICVVGAPPPLAENRVKVATVLSVDDVTNGTWFLTRVTPT